MNGEPLDVVVVGAGLAGAAAAAVLGRGMTRVAIVEPHPDGKPAFKAEKIEPDQAAALRRLGLFDAVRPAVVPIPSVTEAHGGFRLGKKALEQYGMRYEDLVASVRRAIPASVERYRARVVRLGAGTVPGTRSVELDTGERLTSRLVMLATGTGGERLLADAAIERRVVRAPHSLCSGFDVVREDGGPFPFDSLTYWADRLPEAVDYVTFFPLAGTYRVNVFAYRDPKDPWVHELARDPVSTLRRAMPGLSRITGRWRVTSKVETRAIDLYVASSPVRDGLLLLGDTFQSVCPATGTGLSKVLTDIERCVDMMPAWLATPGMGVDKIAAYYADPVKVATDARSLEWAENRRGFGTNRSLKWWFYRRRIFAGALLRGWQRARRS